MQRYTGARGGGHITHAYTIRGRKKIFHPFGFHLMFCLDHLAESKSFFLLTKLNFSEMRFTLFQCQKNDKNNVRYNK